MGGRRFMGLREHGWRFRVSHWAFSTGHWEWYVLARPSSHMCPTTLLLTLLLFCFVFFSFAHSFYDLTWILPHSSKCTTGRSPSLCSAHPIWQKPVKSECINLWHLFLKNHTNNPGRTDLLTWTRTTWRSETCPCRTRCVLKTPKSDRKQDDVPRKHRVLDPFKALAVFSSLFTIQFTSEKVKDSQANKMEKEWGILWKHKMQERIQLKKDEVDICFVFWEASSE